MHFNFELILFLACVITGFFYLLDVAVFARKREANQKMPLVFDYSRSFFPVLVLVLLLRSFVVEPFRIPSGSLEPTLKIGDFIVVNKFSYGLRLPVFHNKILKLGEPKVGDIIVFRFPPDPSVNYIKRVIGVPGDKISYIDKKVYINGKLMPQILVGKAFINSGNTTLLPATEKIENLKGVAHKIYVRSQVWPYNFSDLVVPKGYYFVMGDNRDDSMDSRYWGFVPEANIEGKAFLVWLSWNGMTNSVRWHRFGSIIH